MSIYKGTDFVAGVPDLTGYATLTDLSTKTTANDVATQITSTLASLYPVGAIYMGVQSTCPLATLIPSSEWSLVATAQAIFGAGGALTAGQNIPAGLPNITGSASNVFMNNEYTSDGALSKTPISNVFNVTTSGGSAHTTGTISFSASSSNSIYGASNTVQPPAYVVNVWQRTA